MRRARAFVVSLVLVGSSAGTSWSQVPDATCTEAFSAAPEQIKKGQFALAHVALLRCAEEPCPHAMRPLCAEELRQLEPRVPSVVLSARSSEGKDVVDARVLDHGVVIASSLDGRAVDVDPGLHVFRFERPGEAAQDVQVLVREGEKDRAVLAIFPSAAVSPAQSRSTTVARRPIPWTVVLAGTLSVGATIPWAVFGIDGISELASLSSCKGHCAASSVHAVNENLYVADGFMAAALVGYVVTGALFFTRPSVQVSASPTRGGYSVGVGGNF
jgi:hypothetical protein